MKLTRKLFYNKKNGQASLVIPAKTIKKLKKKFDINSLDNISFQISDVKGNKINTNLKLEKKDNLKVNNEKNSLIFRGEKNKWR